MAVELATAYISLVPTTVNLKPAMEKQFAPVQGIAEDTGRQAGDRFASGFQSRTSKVGHALGATLKTGITVATAAASAAGAVGIATAAQMEQSEISFSTMLGSAKKAKTFLADLSAFAAKTPFDMPGLQSAASSLVSAGIDSAKIIPIMTSLGNATSGMGTGAAGIQRATVALQQMNAAGKISGEDLNQLRDAGIPVFDLLTAATGKTTAEIADMADKGKLGREELEQLMKALETGKGLERFNGLMEKQSASLTGLWSTFKDTFAMGMADVVKPLIPLLKQGLGGATSFLSDVVFPKAKAALKETVGGIVAFGAAWKANDGDVTSSGFPGFMERAAYIIHQGWDKATQAINSFKGAWDANDGDVTSSGFNGFMESTANVIHSSWDKAQQAIRAFTAAWDYNDGEVTSSGFNGFMERAGYFMRQLWESIRKLDFSSFNGLLASLDAKGGTVGPALASIGDSFRDLWPAVKEFKAQMPDLSGGLSLFASVLGFVADHVDDLIAWMPAIVAGFVAWKVAQMALNAAQTAAIPVQLVLNVTRIAAARAEHANAVALRTGTSATVTNTTAQNVSLGTRLRNTAAIIGQRVATLAAAAAARVAAAGQWLLNAAMNANPISIIVLAIAALVAGLIWFFTQTELGREIIKNVWGAIQAFIGATVAWFQTYVLPGILAVFQAVGAIFQWLWTNIIEPVFGFIVAYINAWWLVLKFIFDAVVAIITNVLAPIFVWLYKNVIEPVFGFLGALIGAWWKIVSFIFNLLVAVITKVIAPAFVWLWQSVIKPVFDFIGALISWWWNNIVLPVFNAGVAFIRNVLAPIFNWLWQTIIKPAFDGIGAAIKWVWEHVIKPVFDRLSDVIQKDIPKAFDEGVKFVKKVWEGIQEIVKAPIRFVVNTVLNDGLIAAMNGLADFLKIDKLPRIALPQGFAAGGWTGPGSKYTPAGLVHADEHVIRKESRQRMERATPGLLEHINRYGTLAGYAGGGRVAPLRGQLFVTRGWDHVHKGIDYAAGVGTPVFATQNGVVSWAGPGVRAPGVWGGNEVHIAGGGFEAWFAHLSEIMVALGQKVLMGQRIGMSGNTGISSGPHLHFGVFSGGWPNDLDPTAYLGGAGTPAGGPGWNPIQDIIGGLMDAFKKGFPNGGFLIDVIGGLGKTVLNSVADFVGHIFSGATDKKGALTFDGGGWLENTGGLQLIEHRRSRPDAVLSAPQWDTMARIAEGAAAAGPGIVIEGNVYGNPQDIVDELDARKRRAAALHNLSAITIGG